MTLAQRVVAVGLFVVCAAATEASILARWPWYVSFAFFDLGIVATAVYLHRCRTRS